MNWGTEREQASINVRFLYKATCPRALTRLTAAFVQGDSASAIASVSGRAPRYHIRGARHRRRSDLSSENEAFLAQKELGKDKLEIVVPSVSILAEPPVAVVDKRGTRQVAIAAGSAAATS